jgi:TonB family protein
VKACHRLAILIGFSLLVPHCPLLGQEQSGSSSANGKMRFRFSSSQALARMEAERLPEYPKDVVDKDIEGTVILHVVVGDDGSVMQAEAIFGRSDLTKSAIDAVKQWRFGRTLVNQQPVEVDTTWRWFMHCAPPLLCPWTKNTSRLPRPVRQTINRHRTKV